MGSDLSILHKWGQIFHFYICVKSRVTTPYTGPDDRKATVNGMVCSFCAQGILAYFKKYPAVSDAHVDLTRKIVLLEERKGGSITDKEITEPIRKSGFEPVKVERLKQRFDEAKKAG